MTSIILGYYGSSSTPFCLYSKSPHFLLCLEDIDILFYDSQLKSKASTLQQIYKENKSDFMKMSDGRIYVMTRSVIRIARLLNMYSLAELCKLTPNEILGKVAEPLLRIIQCEQWQTISPSPCIVNIEIVQCGSLDDNEWFINSSDTCMIPNGDTMHHHKSIEYNTKDCITLHQWLSSTIHENCSPQNCSTSMIQTLISAAKIKRQQQAIIEARQRLTAFNVPIRKDKSLKSATSNGVIVFERKKSKRYTSSLSSNLAGSIKDNGLSSHTSPTMSHSLKRKRSLQAESVSLKKKTTRHQEDSLHPFHSSPHVQPHKQLPYSYSYPQQHLHHIHDPHPKSPHKSHSQRHLPRYHSLIHTPPHRPSAQQYYSPHDNLNLLATQATQMRDMSISPDIPSSPPPLLMPPKNMHAHPPPRLPSLQTMLSELRQPSFFQIGRNMDSYA